MNATLCAGDNVGLSQNTNLVLVNSCGNPKCEYVCNAGYALQNGACVMASARNTSCTDSDGGSNQFVRGVLNYRRTDGSTVTFTDACTTHTGTDGVVQIFVNEYNCSVNYAPVTPQMIFCAVGCSNGACQRCTPGQYTCGPDGTQDLCNADGTGYRVRYRCSAGLTCRNGVCE